MPTLGNSPALADAADVLSDQLHVHLQRMARVLKPHADALERQFLSALRKKKLDVRQRAALAAITPGAAARVLARKNPPARFFEQVEYNGRRLAKLNLPPSEVVIALEEYDRLLQSVWRGLPRQEIANLQWVREQLHFCVILTLNNAYYQVREAETQAFYELFRGELESRNLDEVVRRFLETLVDYCRADQGRLYLLDQDSGAWVGRASVFRNGSKKPPKQMRLTNTAVLRRGLARPRTFSAESRNQNLIVDPSWRGRFASYWSVPLEARGRMAGVVQFAFERKYEWLPREQELLSAAAERCLLSAEKALLMEDLAAREAQVRQLAEHMLHVEEVERRRISRELHDEAGQSLLCIRLQLEMIERALPAAQTELSGKLKELLGQTDHTIVEIRRLIAALSPAVLEQLGLGAAVRQLISRFRRRHPCRVRLQLTRLAGLPQKTETIVYRLLQECCNNIAKHSFAKTVNISVASADGILKLNVQDNGVGFDLEEALTRRDSFGLAGVRERVALLGGRFEVESRRARLNGNGNGMAQRRTTERVGVSGAGFRNGSGGGSSAPAGRTGWRGGPKTGTWISIELPIPSE